MDVDPVSLLVDTLKIYSPSSAESDLAHYLEDAMRSMGYSRVRIDGAGNVLGQVGKGPRKVLLCGHMDTVPGPLPVEKAPGSVFGRGAADAKSPLCALLVAGALSAEAGVSITFAGVTREETDSHGVLEIAKVKEKFDYAVFGEPGGAGRLTVGYRGRVGVHLSVVTQGGHAGAPWANRSALDEFLDILRSMKEFESDYSVEGDRFHSVSVTPTIVSAGSHHNVVPSSCKATLDVRLPPGVYGAEAARRLRSAAAGTGRAEVRVTFDEATEAYEAPKNSVLLRAFQRGILLRLKEKPVLTRKTGTGDMNTFAAATGATCLTYGPGESDLSHTDAERVEVKDYLNSIEVLCESLGQLGTLSS